MALPGESGSKGGSQNNKLENVEDKDFDPSAEALIDEIDDERTIEEEEALDGGSGNKVQEELDDLKRESEMPIEELLAYYEKMRNESGQIEGQEEEEDEEDDEDEDEEVDDEDNIVVDNRRDDDEDRPDKSNGAVKSGRSSKPTSTNPSSTQQQQSGSSSRVRNVTNQDMSQKTNQASKMQTVQVEESEDVAADLGAHSSDRTEGDIPQEAITVVDTDELGRNTAVDISLETQRPSMTDFIPDDDETGRMFKTLLDYDLDDSDDMDEDYSYSDEENERDWRRVIHVGPEHQAEVPEDLSAYDDSPPYENDDKLVWRSNDVITQEQILEYLKRASSLSKRTDISISPASVPKISYDTLRFYREKMQDITTNAELQSTDRNHENCNGEIDVENVTDVYMSQSRKRARIDYELEQENALDGTSQSCGPVSGPLNIMREDNSSSTSRDARPEPSTEEYFYDEEQLLYLLLQCNHNFDEAIRRRKLDPFKFYLYEPMSLWSQEECLGFEHGLRIYGKDFRAIRDNKVQTRTYAEVVAFYYLWKKSERHDVYTNQYKLDKKRCLSHPGTTDYMDKFIEDNESNLNASSTSQTPTPTGSIVGTNQLLDTPTEGSPIPVCHSTDLKTSTIQYMDLPQEPIMQRHHLQLHQTSTNDSGGQQSNSVFVESNTAI